MKSDNYEDKQYGGFVLRVYIHQDEDMGPPWQEHDGHGKVSDWKSREDKQPGERPLSSDRGSYRFYNWAGAMKTAKADGWGLSDENKQELAKRKGKPVERLTTGEITAEAVQRDFEYLQGWAQDEWHWSGYTTEYSRDAGETWQDGEASVWGFDDEEYMVGEAFGSLKHEIDTMLKNEAETALNEPACLI